MHQATVVWLNHLDLSSSSYFPKIQSLARLTQAGFNVPAGFVLTKTFQEQFWQENALVEKISQLLQTLNLSDPKDLLAKSEAIKKLILTASFPKSLEHALFSAYLDLIGQKRNNWLSFKTNPPVVVSSSLGTTQEVQGEANLAHAVRNLWADNFSAGNLTTLTKDLSLLVCLKPTFHTQVEIYSFDQGFPNKSKLVVKSAGNNYQVTRQNPSEIDLVSTTGKTITRAQLNALIALFLELEK